MYLCCEHTQRKTLHRSHARRASATRLTTQPSDAFRFASAVAAYADLLRGGQRIDGWNWGDVARTARAAKGQDPYGLKAEFVRMIGQAHRLVGVKTDAPAVAVD